MNGSKSPERRHSYAAAMRAACALAGFGPTGLLRSDQVARDPETVERYRLLLLALAVARGGSDGAAVAAVLRRGYVVVPGTSPDGRVPPGVYPITTPGTVWLGIGLPRLGSPWRAMAHAALAIDVAALPQVHVVSAHASLRIRCGLRAEAHDLG